MLSQRKRIKIIHTPARECIQKEIEKKKNMLLGVQAVFLALPPEQSMLITPLLLEKDVKVLDLSGAYRLKGSSLYKRWYGFTHLYPYLLKKAVYGLPEKQRKLIKDAKLIALPGCYPTAAILGLLPIVATHLLSSNVKIVIKATSGYTGGGKKTKIPTIIELYSQGREHRHIPEIEQELKLGEQLLFYAHKAPWPRGIEMEIGFKTRINGDILSIYRKFYKNDLFVKVTDENIDKKQVVGANLCYIRPTIDRSSVTIYVVIDNLLKGAAGQAMQNFNLMFGFKEEEGLL